MSQPTKIANYEITETLYQGRRSVIYRAIGPDEVSVIIKARTSFSTTSNDKLRREFELGQRCRNSSYVVRYLELVAHGDGIAIVMEDFKAVNLDQFISAQSVNLNQFLEIAIQLVEGLETIHDAGITHKDIKPANIVINEKGKICYIDFELASVAKEEVQEIEVLQNIAGTLQYMSPEQTGRMDQVVDYRTDFYSLGMVFYKLLVGRLPFVETELSKIVHCHIAVPPKPPVEIDPRIPLVISNIVMKLLAKNADGRYQSAGGLKADLLRCQEKLLALEALAVFPLGQEDLSSIKFSIPQRLYGRDKERNILLKTFAHVSDGTKEFLLVSGFSGIGKTALVKELQEPVIKQGGYFLSGKYDQLHGNIAYGAFAQAVQGLIKHLLSEREEIIQQWKSELLSTLGNNGQLLIDIIPMLGIIIGEQPPVPEVGPEETQNRFNTLFQKFIGVVATKEHPIVLFLDDLQWADSGSLNLIKVLATDKKLSSLLLLGSYRSNEVDAIHPLMRTIEEIKKEGIAIEDIRLEPLAKEAVNQLTADTLHCSTEHSASLMEFLYQKTEGNSFCVRAFLEFLHKEELLKLETDSESNKKIWQWDISSIEKAGVPNGLMALMEHKIKRLPEPTIGILKIAACLGNTFCLADITAILRQPDGIIPVALFSALAEGVVIQKGADKFLFPHDKIRENFYLLITPEEKTELHLKIGRMLLNNKATEEELEQRLFDIVGHLILGLDKITDFEERIKVAQLCLRAGLNARKIIVYQSAVNYLEHGLKSLGTDCWNKHYDLSYELHQALVEVFCLNTNFEKAEALEISAIAQARTGLEKARIYYHSIHRCATQGKYADAIKCGKDALTLLEVNLPEKNFDIDGYFRDKDIQLLLKMPETQDPKMQLINKILASLTATAYFVDRDLLRLIVLKTMIISLEHGPAQDSSLGYAMYALMLSSFLGQYQKGYEFGMLGMKLSERFNNKAVLSKVGQTVTANVIHWKRSLHEVTEIQDRSLAAAQESGALEWAGYLMALRSLYLFYRGINLDHVQQEVTPTFENLMEKHHYFGAGWVFAVGLAANYLSNPQKKKQFEWHGMTEEQFIEKYKGYKIDYPITVYAVLKQQLLYLMGDYKLALEHTEETQKILSIAAGIYSVVEYNFYHSLILTALYTSTNEEATKKQYLSQLEANQQQMKIWAENCPINFSHKYLLVSAEIERIKGGKKWFEIIEIYDDGIRCAKESRFIQDEALANELIGKFYLAINKELIARTYIQEASCLYSKWGAMCKVRELQIRYPNFVYEGLRGAIEQDSLSGAQTINATYSTVGSDSNIQIDMRAIIDTSQALSGEVELESLLTKVMSIIMVNAGAQKVAFLLKTQDGLLVEAENEVDKGINVMENIALNSWNNGSLAVIRYVYRVKKSVILGNATEDGRFNQDRYISDNHTASILCVPIINQSELLGILYLENSVTINAFPKNRIEVLQILATQIGISLKNLELFKIKARQELFNRTLPSMVVTELEQKGLLASPNRYSKYIESATVMFADIVGFTEKCNKVVSTAPTIVLNQLFTEFDRLTRAAGLEKIKTIGDAYMVAGGVLDDRKDHLQAMIFLAVEMRNYCEHEKIMFAGEPLQMRFGIATGPMIAGIIGTEKLQYDIIGSTVNLAARLEASGKPGRIHITEQTHEILAKDELFIQRLEYECGVKFGFQREHSCVDLKGFGAVATCLISPDDLIIKERKVIEREKKQIVAAVATKSWLCKVKGPELNKGAQGQKKLLLPEIQTALKSGKSTLFGWQPNVITATTHGRTIRPSYDKERYQKVAAQGDQEAKTRLPHFIAPNKKGVKATNPATVRDTVFGSSSAAAAAAAAVTDFSGFVQPKAHH